MAAPDEFDPFDGGEGQHGWAGRVPDFVRKMAVAGLGAIFLTEEGIRSLASQLKLPKEVLQYVLSSAEKTKDELGRVVSEELRGFLQSEKLRDEFLKLLTGMTVEIKAQVRLVPSDHHKSGEAKSELQVQPKVEIAELSAKRGRKKKE